MTVFFFLCGESQTLLFFIFNMTLLQQLSLFLRRFLAQTWHTEWLRQLLSTAPAGCHARWFLVRWNSVSHTDLIAGPECPDDRVGVCDRVADVPTCNPPRCRSHNPKGCFPKYGRTRGLFLTCVRHYFALPFKMKLLLGLWTLTEEEHVIEFQAERRITVIQWKPSFMWVILLRSCQCQQSEKKEKKRWNYSFIYHHDIFNFFLQK